LVIGGVFVSFHLNAVTRTAIAEANLTRLIEICVLFGLFFWMFICSLIYMVADFGHEKRRAMHGVGARSVSTQSRNEIDPLLVLIPSYKEEQGVIRQALISAALVEYPRRRVVLLIDDPPNPGTAEGGEGLARSRRLPATLQAEFDEAARPFKLALIAFQMRERYGKIQPLAENNRLARLYEDAASWIEAQSVKFARSDSIYRSHTDRLFVEKILLEPARMHRQRAEQMRRRPLKPSEIADEYRRLAYLFDVEFSSFERKRYENLSHAPNKAMNLNSYIALIGRRFREVKGPDGLHLEPCETACATLHVPAASYIATVDADSLITGDFALRLVQVMEEPGNERIAVAQTPYTAIPDAPSRLERTAAASTDVQFFNHQGMAYFSSSWWVGASALMRHAALQDIAIEVEERGYKVKVYIQDKILIEDAAATIDLVRKGWRIYHDPSRLSYSATPPDFGALIIQRHRWSNGGLLIVPMLLRYVFRWPWSLRKFGEALLRVQNLLSAGISGAGLPYLLLWRFDDSLVPLWMPLVTLPYYLLYGSDLVLAGYRWRDLPRVYVLNTILLVPVYLAGTLQSIRQAFSGRPGPFKRTPKIENRTPVPVAYLLIIYGILFYGIGSCVYDLIEGRLCHAFFSMFNGMVAFYGCAVLIGFRASWDDFRAGMMRFYRALLLRRASLKPAVKLQLEHRPAAPAPRASIIEIHASPAGAPIDRRSIQPSEGHAFTAY
jgi:cellulose synthase/poly-beta-1,6-N-acetylglucosamine synthase-like glycosyltransferase